jgi:hypothetical protein
MTVDALSWLILSTNETHQAFSGAPQDNEGNKNIKVTWKHININA